MARRIIHIEPTEEQWLTIDEIYGSLGAPFIAAVTDEQGEPTGDLWAVRIVDDFEVRLYTIRFDGSCVYEELEGLNLGWTRYDEGGGLIEDDE